MSTFDRITNVGKGALSNAAGDIERNNPEAVYEAAIDKRTAAIGEHMAALSGLAARRDKHAAAVQTDERELAQLTPLIEAAKDQGEEEVARQLQDRRRELTGSIERQTADVLGLAEQVEQTKAALVQLREHVQELKREQVAALAQLSAAEAQVEIHDSVMGLSDKASERALDSVRESVNVMHRKAHEGYLDSEGNSIRGKVEAMTRSSAKQDAREELERLKREYAQSKADEEAS